MAELLPESRLQSQDYRSSTQETRVIASKAADPITLPGSTCHAYRISRATCLQVFRTAYGRKMAARTVERTLTQTIWNTYRDEVRRLWLPEDGSKGMELAEMRAHFRQTHAFNPT